MKKLMLITPMLHQGGFERVCVTTARLMQKYYDVTVLIFSDKDIHYDVSGLNIVNIDLPARKGKYAKAINLIKRVIKVRKLKKELGIDISYSFGSSANYVNALSKGKEKVFTGLRCSTDMESPKQVKLFCSKADQVLSCSREIMRQLSTEYNYDRSSYIYNPLDVETINIQAKEKIDDLPFGLTQDREDIKESKKKKESVSDKEPGNKTNGDQIDENKADGDKSYEKEKGNDNSADNEMQHHHIEWSVTPDSTFTIRRNVEKVETEEDNRIKLVVSVGRQDYIKGFWHLIKAFSLVAKEKDNVRLMILGTGDWTPYHKLVESLGLKDKVAFMGIKKNPFPYVAASDLYVLSSNHEGFPNALLEAMALGKPCIAADCKTGPREIVLTEDEYNSLLKIRPDGSSTDKAIEGEYGILVPDMSEVEDFNPDVITVGEKALAREMNKILSDNDKLEKFGLKARERADCFQPEKYSAELNSILEKL